MNAEAIRTAAGYAAGLLSGIGMMLLKHWLDGGRLKVRARFEPDVVPDQLFTHSTQLRLHIVNVGRREVKVERVGAIYRTPWPLGHDCPTGLVSLSRIPGR